ncbi:MAG: ribonuclease J [Candidatus Portnoybacteria bacterium CG_4_10_14_0_2_um_filter_39_11]|uniref:Ribonuclease J n=1 Tax=Candidatus Portnoybacteria bacterium CG_4_10_14_0_2_um_filter_39_11 TaxID=1974797 RepID=A0A2M7UH30_9BACT|nr:MAG: ribonuclease J [Candidatus Portnoybacteria bacterium CG_4_10_14_0_2_um_filter_39_11]
MIFDLIYMDSHKQKIVTKNDSQKRLKIIPLGGLEEVGRNMTILEYGHDIIIVDMGLQFPEENMFGIDYIIPNVSYLKGKEKNIQGVIITHGHYDHIGAIPHLMPVIGNPPIYATALTCGLIQKRQEDFLDRPKLELFQIKKTDRIKLGVFEIEFFHVNHNIPDGVGLAIKTPVGLIIHTGDFKFDHSPIGDQPADISRIAQLSQNNVLLLMSDSTNAEKPGHSISEKTIQDNLEIIFRKAEGRIIVATFGSLISRIQEVINLAEKYRRRVVIDGYSMRTNFQISQVLGYIKIRKGTLARVKEVNKIPDNRLVFLCTGAQGEENAVLMRIANKEHKYVQIHKNDSIIFSSSVVPGNERTVQGLKDSLWRQGGRVFHYQMMDIHAGGHAQEEDLKMMINLVKPRFFMPIHGSYYMLKMHAEIAQSLDIPEKNIIIGENGKVINITPQKLWLSKEKVVTSYVMVDGLGVGDVGQIVLRDRQTMAKDGMFVIIATIDRQTAKLRNEPDIISRGFIYMKESKELIDETKKKVSQIIDESTKPGENINDTYVRDNLRDQIGEFLFRKTQRRPMILPVVIEV